jgi:hypothetical protein
MRWVADRDHTNPAQIVAVLFHDEAREIYSKNEWDAVKGSTQRADAQSLPFRRVYVVPVKLCQSLVDPIPDDIGKETGARMHTFRPLAGHAYDLAKPVELVRTADDKRQEAADGGRGAARPRATAPSAEAGHAAAPADDAGGLPDNEAAGDDEATLTDSLVKNTVRSNEIAQIYDKFVSTTSPTRWLNVYKDLTMYHLTLPLQHAHTPYCGKAALGFCRFGFPHEAVERTEVKTAGERLRARTKQRYKVRRRADALYMGLYNPVILRRWRASMDLQVVESGHAVAQYIMGYVLKNETERDAMLRVQHLLATLPATSPVQAQTVYRLAYMAWQGRVTSTFEACHMLLGLPVVRCSRQFQWVHTGQPSTYSAYVPRQQVKDVLEDPEVADSPAAPAVLERYQAWRAAKVRDFDMSVEEQPPCVLLLVEGEDVAKVHVKPADLTLFDGSPVTPSARRVRRCCGSGPPSSLSRRTIRTRTRRRTTTRSCCCTTPGALSAATANSPRGSRMRIGKATRGPSSV